MKTPTTLFFVAALTGSALFAQIPVAGVIKDPQGASVVGASVQINDTGATATTDANGRFTLTTAATPPFTVTVRSLGYESAAVTVEQLDDRPVQIVIAEVNVLDQFLVTARRRAEPAQEVPLSIAVVGGAAIESAQAFNVNRLKELVPSVQLYSSNPRNTGINIRGLGSTFGLTNDGLEPGVGFYVDGVYYARPAATTLDFIDVEQIEVLRGPQGTLFGKNTTSGAFNITTRKPSFTPGGTTEVSYGDYGYVQAKASITGPLSETVAARLSFSGTQRDGLLYNRVTQKRTNELNNLGFRGQLLFTPTEKLDILVAADTTRQRPDGYAQPYAGSVTTLRAGYRQFDQIIASLGYTVPNPNPFDRVIDHDTSWRSGQDLGGASVNVDLELDSGTITSTSAWRFWNWDPSNDRDFTGLQALALSQAPSKHEQWSQEIRWAGSLRPNLSGVVGVFYIDQKLRPDSAHTEQAGRDQWRFAQSSTSALWATPGLLDGYGIKSYPNLDTVSAALFGQLDWAITDRLSLLPGLRYNYDDKQVDFRREIYGGLQTTDAALIALQRAVYSNQAFSAQVDDTNLSGQLTTSFKATERISTYATYATSFKPVGLNLGGLPTAGGVVLTELAVLKPEEVRHVEIGLKSTPNAQSILNVSLFNTDVYDYQTSVQAPDLALNRGYLANADHIRVRGVELDGSTRFGPLSLRAALTYSDGKYVRFTNAPPPLEETGGPTFKDVSGGRLPGVSKWSGSFTAEYARPTTLLGRNGEGFFAVDTFYRSEFSSSPSPSRFLNVDGYSLVNARLGFRVTRSVTAFLWARNVFDRDYFEQLLPGAGNAGQYAAVLGDPRTVGVTLRFTY